MKSKRVEAMVLERRDNSTSLLIRASDAVVQATYSELAPCQFPVWTGTPVQVELPFGGVKRHVAGLTSEDSPRKNADGGLPDIIRFPVYSSQIAATPEAFENLPRSARSRGNTADVISREPLVAIGISASGQTADGSHVETHGVLPIWLDDTAVLVTLNWYEGEPNEGTPNSEWYLRGTEGMPLEEGIRTIRSFALWSSQLSDKRYALTMSPWKLGEALLGNPGHEIKHKIWQREWSFASFDDFRVALGRFCDGLLGLTTTEHQSLAGQRA
ncbi:MAG: hypothetical protein IT585_06720 [candidate division Zixibacteria bacterium]|nr:hypothetical protein [candidate division Zixibacteria bacterium]